MERNGSPAYSIKLFGRFNGVLGSLQKNPYRGRPSDIPGIRVLVVDAYLVFYEVMADAIVIHHIWHSKRDLTKLKF